ncbi:Peptidoglycan/LPS O-acetylase OafA/YrhL, contains acyltransferase and SGNH-hydrolase domains [Micromonospora pattaloongensis]|uniref:Peptidoglycan/LPS O-acetylase OafA/YrhL, contains acyltransferase and SGNH-hydrolase domains n=1 Tax=Micromonospora pattaloongensis TaxID=405436 RepID=A0A1H3KQX9_9ACTN|nr:acyltransferase [Micromonospora pattaloongensis]SDY54085.1 Peptidoglycan/LPS O-acetylase OafA/YrhL, contains acyltransferase and SGNH-hydrolase domains [Micromonospora pattaloongensis]
MHLHHHDMATPARPSSTPPSGPPRLGWLDALRGISALVVVYFHLSPYVLPHGRQLLTGWVQLGPYGVLVFFLVSGYVIPMSLERYGSLRRFWVGRIFRIYPAYLLTVGAMLFLVVLGLRKISAKLVDDPISAVLAHATMLQDLVGVPSLVGVFWTLSYEMIFYVLMSALFVLGLHRRCDWWAVGLAATALIGGRALPDDLLDDLVGRVAVTTLVAVALGATVAAYILGRRDTALLTAVVGLGALALPLLNGSADAGVHGHGSWESLTFLAVMFSGTVVHAAHHGRMRASHAAVTLGTVLACLLLSVWFHAAYPAATATQMRIEAVSTLIAVAATFALGFALRHRRVPGWLTWLGRVSYSVYLLHTVVLIVFIPYLRGALRWPFPTQIAAAMLYLAAVLVVSWLSYHLVEMPGQRLGKRVGRALDRRFGPDRAGASADVVTRAPRGPGRRRAPRRSTDVVMRVAHRGGRRRAAASTAAATAAVASRAAAASTAAATAAVASRAAATAVATATAPAGTRTGAGPRADAAPADVVG